MFMTDGAVLPIKRKDECDQEWEESENLQEETGTRYSENCCWEELYFNILLK